MSITNGTVSIEDGNKAGEEYAPARKVRVELSFNVPEGADALVELDYVAGVAQGRVDALLGRKGRTLLVVHPGDSTPPAAPPETNAETPRRPRRSAVEIAADKAAKLDRHVVTADPDVKAHIEENKAAPPAEDEFDPTADSAPEKDTGVDMGVDDPVGDAIASKADVSVSDLDEEDFTITPDEPAAPEISDADLNSAVQKRNGELGNPKLIRGLISEYNPDVTQVFQLRQIPQAERAGFLAKLAKLTA